MEFHLDIWDTILMVNGRVVSYDGTYDGNRYQHTGLAMAAGLAFKGRFQKRIWMWVNALWDRISRSPKHEEQPRHLHLSWYMNRKHMHLEYIWFTWYMGCTYDPKSKRNNTWLQCSACYSTGIVTFLVQQFTGTSAPIPFRPSLNLTGILEGWVK